MPRQIDYRSTSDHPADDLYATMVDPDFLRARLARMGGPGAELLSHDADIDGVRYRVRHGLDAKDLPSVVRSVLSGNVMIERSESWKRDGAGRYLGQVDVAIHGTPASAVGGMLLRNADAGSELLVRADVAVKVPLIGGRIEAVVAEQVQNLLRAESEFTSEWLSARR